MCQKTTLWKYRGIYRTLIGRRDLHIQTAVRETEEDIFKSVVNISPADEHLLHRDGRTIFS